MKESVAHQFISLESSLESLMCELQHIDACLEMSEREYQNIYEKGIYIGIATLPGLRRQRAWQNLRLLRSRRASVARKMRRVLKKLDRLPIRERPVPYRVIITPPPV